MMLRAIPHLNEALAMVAFFHQFSAHTLASRVTTLPIVPFDSAVMPVAHFFLRPEVGIVHAAFQGSSLPLMTFVVVTLPSGCRTVMVWFTGRPL